MPNNLIIDEPALHRHRSRALAMAQSGVSTRADFLMHQAADDLSLRLSTITREFKIAVDLNSVGVAVSDAMRLSGKCGQIIQSRVAAFKDKQTSIVHGDDMLPIANDSVDLIASTLALQFANDLPGILVQIRRALKPDGLFMGAVLGGGTLHELRESFLQAESEIKGSAHARVLPFMDVRAAGGLLQRAGFALPVADIDTLTVRYDTALELMHDLRAMGSTNCLFDRDKKFLSRAVLARMIEVYAQNFSDPDGRIRATFEIISLSGWTPHESQQKPLKPGSAQMKLSEVLGDKYKR